MTIRLQPGMTVDLGDGCLAVVVMVNDCSALVQPLLKRTKTVTDRFSGRTTTFEVSEKPYRICSSLPSERVVGWADGRGRS